MGQIDSALYNAFGQNQVSTIYSDINQYCVVLTSIGPSIAESGDPARHLCAQQQGKMVPLSALATYPAACRAGHWSITPTSWKSASVNYNLAKGMTQAEAWSWSTRRFRMRSLPAGVQKKYTGDNQHLLEARAMRNVLLIG